MQDSEIASLLTDLWSDLHKSEVAWQIAVLALCLAFASLFERLVNDRIAKAQAESGRSVAQRLRQGGLRRLVFPLTALVLVISARAVMRDWHHVNLLNVTVPLLLALAGIRLTVYALRQAFQRGAAWLGIFEKSFATAAWLVAALHITGVLPAVIEGMEQVTFHIGNAHVNAWMLLQGLFTVLLTLLAALWMSGSIETRLMRTEGLDSNLRLVLVRLSKSVLVLLAILVALPLVGIDLTALSVFGGALGVGLGFGMQKIAANYVSGFIILLDRSIRIGSLISVGGERGVVSEITTRYTVLRGMTGIEVIVPNETLVGSVVQNETFTNPKMRIALTLQVAYNSDVEHAIAIMEECARAQPRVLVDPPPKGFLESFGDSGINMHLGFWIADPHAGTLDVRSAINLAIRRRFQEADIGMPFPQREIHVVHTRAPAEEDVLHAG
ncbi:MAG: mechanosensitive ion channel [Zoogloea sp.]|nr:mechanosensitive ion channel [Zoogloea sp.]